MVAAGDHRDAVPGVNAALRQERQGIPDILPGIVRLLLQYDPLRRDAPGREPFVHTPGLGDILPPPLGAGDHDGDLRLVLNVVQGRVQTGAQAQGGRPAIDTGPQDNDG